MERELAHLLSSLGDADDAGGRQLAVESALTAAARRLPERAGDEPEDDETAWARFLFAVAHRVVRGGAGMLAQAALSHAEGSAVTRAAEHWREQHSDGRLLVRIGLPKKPSRPACLRTLEAHQGAARALAIDAARKLLLTGGDDGAVRAWDLATGVERGEWRTDGHVRAIALHPDGQRVVIAASPYVEIWDLERGTRIAQRASGLAELTHLVLHFDGRRVIVADRERALVRDLERGETLCERVLDRETTELALHPDGQHAHELRGFRTLAAFDITNGETSERTTDPGHSRARIELERAAIAPHAVVAPDGRRAAAFGNDSRVQLWDLGARRTVGSLDGHAGRVHAVRWLASGLRLVSAGDDGTVRLWDPSLAPAAPDPSAHVEPVIYAGISRDGERAVTVCAGGLLKVWDLDAGICVTTQLPFWRVGPDHRVAAAALIADADVVIADDRGALKRVDSLSSRNRWRAVTDGGLIGATADPTGQLLVTVEPRMVRCWNAAAGTPLSSSPAPSGQDFGGALFAFDARRVLVTAGRDLVLLDAPSGEPRAVMPVTARVAAIGRNADAEIVIASDDGVVRWVDLVEGILRSTKAHARPITAVAVLPDNQHIVTASLDRSVAVTTPSGGRVAAWQLDAAPTACAAGPGGRIVVGDVRGEVTLLRLA
jgi:WD40 repeat protein